jgi:hypothetical protein
MDDRGTANMFVQVSSSSYTVGPDGKRKARQYNLVKRQKNDMEELFETERDSETGDRARLKRALGKRGRELRQSRVKGGRVRAEEELFELPPGTGEKFDREWQQRAARESFPYLRASDTFLLKDQ